MQSFEGKSYWILDEPLNQWEVNCFLSIHISVGNEDRHSIEKIQIFLWPLKIFKHAFQHVPCVTQLDIITYFESTWNSPEIVSIIPPQIKGLLNVTIHLLYYLSSFGIEF